MLNYRKRYKENVKLQTAAKFIVDIIVVICAAYIIVTYTCDKTTISGNSMNTKLENNDTVLINKMRYAFAEPKRFDIITFQQPGITSSKTYIKRVIALPKETIQIVDGKVLINGTRLEHDISEDDILTAGLAENPITLGENEYFVLGDNRNNSEDSRFSNIGIIHKKDITGSPWLVIEPFSHIKLVF